MSYVLARDIGCSYKDSPWEYLPQGPNTLFNFPQNPSVMGGKTGTASVNSTTDVGQSFFAYQVARGGWPVAKADGHVPEPAVWYHSMYSQNYPAHFLPAAWNPGPYSDASGVQTFYNLGQIFLNNAFAMTFLKWRPEDLTMELTDRNAPGSAETPIFVNPAAWPVGLQNVQHLLRGSKDPKYGGLINAVLQQANSANDGAGVCRKVLLYISGHMTRNEGNNSQWHNSDIGRWFARYNQRHGISMSAGTIGIPVNFCGACNQTPLTPRMGGHGSPTL